MDERQEIEIKAGMTVEEMKALFFDSTALIEPNYRVYQLNSRGHRYYYTCDENGTPTFYPSVTTIISQTVPQSPFLTKWIADMGYDAAEDYKLERAAYGTFMHGEFEELIIARSYDFDKLRDRLSAYMERERLPLSFIEYEDDFKKDIMAFAQFVKDYDVRPLAVEVALVHKDYGYAGMIDLPCTMRAKIGGDERIAAIVDFKSGRKGFYPDHEIQLGMYRELWNSNFPDKPIQRVFNFSPKDWRKKPTYNLKEQTNSINIQKIPYLLQIAAIEDGKIDKQFTHISGVLNLDGDLTDNIESLSLSELVKRKTRENGANSAPKEKDE